MPSCLDEQADILCASILGFGFVVLGSAPDVQFDVDRLALQPHATIGLDGPERLALALLNRRDFGWLIRRMTLAVPHASTSMTGVDFLASVPGADS